MNLRPCRVAPLVALVVLAACAPSETTSTLGLRGDAPHVIALSATEYAFTAPDTIPAGWVSLRMTNAGSTVHYGHIVRLDSGHTTQDLVEAYASAIANSGPRPKWAVRFGGPGGVAPGGTHEVTEYLEPGVYTWICPVEDESGAPHFGKGEHKTFVVAAQGEGTPDPAAVPAADLDIRLTDFGFSLDSVLPAGPRRIRVENVGAEPHDLVLMRLAEGRSAADVARAMNPEQARRDTGDEPPPSFESLGVPIGGIAAIRGSMQAYFSTDLTPGEYALVCMATAPDGRSHIEHGMLRQFSVR